MFGSFSGEWLETEQVIHRSAMTVIYYFLPPLYLPSFIPRTSNNRQSTVVFPKILLSKSTIARS